jgi:flagellar secretion chaperone FliS
MPLLQLNPWQSYRQVATQTATPGQLVLMLFDGAIRFLECARQGFGFDDPRDFNQTINNNVLRAQAIINELNLALDLEKGGDFAITLRRLYNYMDHRLQEANQYKKEEGIVEVVRRLTTLRDAWAEMLQNTGVAAPETITLSAMG